jgi:hypothetical protein
MCILAVAVICGCSLLSFVVADDKELVAFVATTLGIRGESYLGNNIEKK